VKRAFYRSVCAYITCTLLVSCSAIEKELPVVSHLAEPDLIGWDSPKVATDSTIVAYAGKPFARVSSRDFESEDAVKAYIAWKGGKVPFLPVKTAVEERMVEDWRAIKISAAETFIAGGAFLKPAGVIDQSWILEPKNARIKDGPQLLRARKSCSLSMLSNGKVLISGGLDGSGNPIDECECFDPKTQTVSKFPALCLPRAGHRIIELKDGKLIVVGGKTLPQFADSDGGLTSIIEEWSFPKDRFETVGRAKKARLEPQLSLLDKTKVLIAKGHIFSGATETNESPPAEIYDATEMAPENAK